MNKEDMVAMYKRFKKWCEDNPYLDLDPRLHTHSGPIGDGGYISDGKTLVAFAAWRAALEAAQAEVERLQEAVRPRREDECLTLDHWRIRAYHLEENWSRCSRACAIEQDKREQAEARAKQLAEVLSKILENEASDWKAAEEFGGYVLDDELREEARAALGREEGK